VEFLGIYRELHGRLPALPRRVAELDQSRSQNAVLGVALDLDQSLALVRGETGDVD
jgi:hypothetical protein